MADLQARLIRAIGDPEKRLRRMLCLLRAMIRDDFGFQLNRPRLRRSKHHPSLSLIGMERVHEEVRCLGESAANKMLDGMADFGLLTPSCPGRCAKGADLPL